MIDKFLDEKLEHHYVTEDRSQKTFVKWVNTHTFKKEILDNPDIKQCVIEIVKDHCPACFRSKQNTNMISRKMHLHGLGDQLPFFRMKIYNQVPYLGTFPHSPLHLLLKKEGNQLSEIKMLKTPIPQKNTDEFLKQLEEHGGVTGLSEKVKMDVMAHS